MACKLPIHEILKKIIHPRTRQPITKALLEHHFREELEHGEAVSNALVAQNMFRYASTRNNQAVIAGKFWLTHKAGWKPAVAEDGDNGKITIEVVNRLAE